MSTLRTLARGIAKRKMENYGFAKFCKHDHYGQPFEKKQELTACLRNSGETY